MNNIPLYFMHDKHSDMINKKHPTGFMHDKHSDMMVHRTCKTDFQHLPISTFKQADHNLYTMQMHNHRGGS